MGCSKSIKQSSSQGQEKEMIYLCESTCWWRLTSTAQNGSNYIHECGGFPFIESWGSIIHVLFMSVDWPRDADRRMTWFNLEVTRQCLTCLTRSGLTVVCGCSMLTGSGFWALWGISRTFSAIKLWTPFRASTVPCIRQTRSVVPVMREEDKQVINN